MAEQVQQTQNVRLSEEALGQIRQRAEESLYVFLKGVLGYKDLDPAIHLPLCQLLERQALGEEACQNLAITLPRGWFKTTVCSIGYAIWRAVRNPNLTVLLVQNTFTNAESKLASVDQQFRSNGLLRALWPEVLPTPAETWKTSSMCLARSAKVPESTFECAGTDTSVVSRHYDIIIEDDTVAPDLDQMGEENLMPSQEDIDQAIGFHKLATPLLVDPAKSQRLVVGTRWFEKDLLSFVEEKEPSYKIYKRAAREKDGLPNVDGEPSWPARFGVRTLQIIADSMGPYLFSCLYMNLPLASGDMPFKQDWIKYADRIPYRADLEITISLDTNAQVDKKSRKGDPDYVAIVVCGRHKTKGTRFVLDYWHKQRTDPEEVIEALFDLVKYWGPSRVAVEAIAYQRTLSFWIRKKMIETGVYFFIEEVTHGGKSKEMRILGLIPLVKTGNLSFQTHQRAMIQELLTFPLGIHDDLIDALALHLTIWGEWRVVESVAKEAKGTPGDLSLDGALEEIRLRAEAKTGLGILADAMSGGTCLN